MNAAMEIQTGSHTVLRYQIKTLAKRVSEFMRARQGKLCVLQAAA